MISNFNLHGYAPQNSIVSNKSAFDVSFCARRDKTQNPKDSFEKKLSAFIPLTFQEAKTVAAARKYGREVLGIKEYKGFNEKKDLDIINWINESFAAVHNASKGKDIKPYLINYYDFPPKEQNWYGAMEFTYPLGELSFNSDFLRNIDSRINQKISASLAKHGISYGDVYYADSSSDSTSKYATTPCLVKNKKGEYELNSFYGKSKKSKTFEQNLNRYLKNPQGVSFKDKVSLNFTLNSILHGKYYACNDSESQKSSKPVWNFSLVSPFKCVAHESGHLQHFDKDEKYADFMQEEVMNEDKIIWRKFDRGEEKTAAKITAYAAKSPYEFVAETFAELICNPNIKLDDDVIALYKRHDGPIFFQ